MEEELEQEQAFHQEDPLMFYQQVQAKYNFELQICIF